MKRTESFFSWKMALQFNKSASWFDKKALG